MNVKYLDPTTKKWTPFWPGKTGTANEDLRVWDRPIYAMADGTVISCVMNKKDNPKPGVNLGGGSNNFVIQHGSEKALYLHMRAGSVNAALCKAGATIKAGDKLGHVGNSGNSSSPHLHVQVLTLLGGQMRPLLFHDTHVIERADDKYVGEGSPWVKMEDQALPYGDNAIWPAAQAPIKVVSCATLQADIKELESEIASLKDEIGEAGPSQKAQIAKQIKAAQDKIAALKTRMEQRGCSPKP
jgi:murein DD-endopeptidase MepM/ murein hydrolase activator NlpD